MSQIASFILREGTNETELTDGGCAGNAYTVLFCFLEEAFDIDVHAGAPEAFEALDFIRVDFALAQRLCAALQNGEALYARIAADWEMPEDIAKTALHTLRHHLGLVTPGSVLEYTLY